MSKKKNDKKTDTININLLFSNTGTRLLNVFTINVVSILISGFIGYMLDYYFDTKPLFLISLLVLSFPLSIYLVIKRANQITEKLSNNKKNG